MSSRSVNIPNLTPADLASFRAAIRASDKPAPLAARDILRAGLEAKECERCAERDALEDDEITLPEAPFSLEDSGVTFLLDLEELD